jgi:hypothetical protein
MSLLERKLARKMNSPPFLELRVLMVKLKCISIMTLNLIKTYLTLDLFISG